MAFRTKNINEIFGTVLVLSALLSTASAVDCFGKSFHCVNSTHFMICVDLGGGVSQSIDDFLIPCPPPTVCQGNNHFECEYPAVTTPSTTLSNVISDTTEPWEEIVVTTNSPPKNTSTTKEYSEKYMNTVSITSVAEDNLTTDTTVDVTAEAFSSSDVNSNSNIPELISISPSYEVTTRFDGITNIVSDNIVTGNAEVITAMPHIPLIPLHQIQNVTNETIGDNVTLTLSNTEPIVTLNNNYIFVQNDSVREVKDITSTSPSYNFTSRNISGAIVTADPSMIDTTTTTERPLTLITDESFVTGVNLPVTTAQTLVSTDELQNVANMNIQTTTPEPALIQHTLDKEQFQITGFEENFTTTSVQNSEKEQSNILNPDVAQNVPDQLPITTYQSTVTTVTKMDVKNGVTVETIIASEQPTTVNLSTHYIDHDIYTTEAPLIISTDRKLDTQNFSKSDQVPTKLIDDTIVYRNNEQSTTDINILPTNIDVKTEQLVDITTETQKLPVTDQLKINKDIPVTEQVQKLIDTGIESQKLSEKRATDPDIITEKSTDLATETQEKQRNEQIISTKNTTTTGSDAAAGVSVLLIEAQKLLDKGVQQSKDNTQSLTTENDALTENPIVFTTEIQKLLVTELPKINKNNSAIEQVQKLNDSIIESPKSSGKRLATDPDIITEKLSDLATPTQHKQGNEQIITNKNITTADNNVAAEVIVLPKGAQKPTEKGIQQSKFSTQSLATDNDTITKNPSEFATETPKQLRVTLTTLTGNDVLTEASDLSLEAQTLTYNVVEQRKINTTSSPTEIVSAFTTVTQQSVYLSTELITTTRSDLLSDIDKKTEKAGVYTTVTHEPTKQIIEEEKPIFVGTKNTTTNKNYLSFDNYAIVNKTSDFTTEAQKPIYIGTEQPITRTQSTATDTITENSVLSIEIQTPTYMSTLTTKATDVDVNFEKANVSIMATPKSVSMSTELPITIKNDQATDIKVTTEILIDTATGPNKPTIQIQEEVTLGLSNYDIETEKQKQEGLTTDTNSFAIITTEGVAVQSLGVTEQPIITALVDNIVPDTTISNIDKFHNNISSNAKVTGTTIVQSINTITATTTEPTTIKLAEDKIKGETTAFTSIVKASDSDVLNELPVDNVQIIHNSTDEQPNQNTPEVTADTVAGIIPITVQTVNIKKDNETATAKSTPNLSNGHQIYTNIDETDMSNGLTIDTSFNIINEVKDLSPNTVKPTQEPQSVGEIVDKNQHTTKNNFQVTETAFTTEQTKIHNNVDASDVAISNNVVINEDTSKTVKVNSELHTTERVNLIPGENIAGQLPTAETPATTDLESISTLNLNHVINSIDLNLQKVIKNQSKSTNSVYSDQLTSTAEATSETTVTENFTPSLNSNSMSSQKNKHLTSNNQVTTEITNTVVDNLAEEASSFTTATESNSILKENGNIYKTLTNLNTQDNSYVSFTTEEIASLHGNIASNQIPKLTTVSENEAHETSLINYPNNEVDYFTSIPRVVENTETAFTQQSTTIGGIDYESHVSTKNEMDQHVEITTQIFSTRQPMQTIESNKNTNNLLYNPLSNILLDKINEAVSPVTESSTSFRIKNNGNINSMGILSFGTYSEIDNGSTQLPQMQNANGVTIQPSIPIVRTNDNLPSSSLDSLSVAGDLHKAKYPASIAKTENLSIIQTETILKETFITKEDLFLNGGNAMTTSAVPKTDSTTEFSIKESVKNVYKTIESYFNTPSETSTPESFKEKGNGAINPILSPHDFSTKTSSSMYNTESSLYGTKDNYDSRVSKLGPVPPVNNLKPNVTYSGYSTKTTKIEMTTESSKNQVEGNIALNKPVISAAVPVPDYNIEINTSNINKPIPIASHGTKTSESKTLQELDNSATYYPRKYVTSAMNNYQYVTEKSDTSTSSKSNGSSVNIFPEATVSSQQSVNSFKTVAKSLSGQINEKNLVNPNKSQYNSSFYADAANFGSKLTIATEYTDFKSSNNLSNAADKQSPSKSHSNFTIATNQVTEKVLATNTNKDLNSAAKENKLQNNSSFGHSTITVIPSKNVSQDITKNGLSLSRNATNTTKFNTPKSPPKTITHSTEHNLAQVEPMSTKQNKIHSVITTSQAPIKKITPRPVVSITTTESPSKQIPKTALANFGCINGIRGRYSDKDDCRKFYICFGNSQPIVGNCPANTVFSDISKLCTKNLSHCIRENEFKCPVAGRFSDVTKVNVYYICVSYKTHLYRFKLQCQIGFTLNKTTINCEENRKIKSNQPVSISLSQNSNDGSIKTSTSSISSASSSGSSSSTSTSSDSSSSSSSNDSSSGDSNGNSSSNRDSSSSKRKEKKESKEKPEDKEGDEEDEVFECEKEGKFPVRNDCKRYYLCKKNGKSEYRRKIKKCQSGEVFHKGKKNNKNSSESSDSDSNDDRRPSNSKQRKEKKGKPAGKEDEDDDQEVFKCGIFPVSGDCKQEKKESKEKPEGKGDEEDEIFECEKEGKFPIRNDCKRYYLCKKNRKSDYRRKIKKCESDEVFHKAKKKCVDADSYEC
ncbi:uncharacterized protein [Choristoneura fumiferana]|uniref:uncharacterized protein n=1 Tax=Choristoneura fumiferana TaxID=7141 RepID=UPI003D155F99